MPNHAPSSRKTQVERWGKLCLGLVLGLTIHNLWDSVLLIQSKSTAGPTQETHKDISQSFEQARLSPQSWLDFLREPSRTSSEMNSAVQTQRIGCREAEYGAQSCVFEGFICIDASQEQYQKSSRPLVYFVDDTKPDGSEVENDNFCQLRHRSIDPRYYSGRHWPIPTDMVAPLHSCLTAVYRRTESLFPGGIVPHRSTKWLSDLWLFDLDYPNNPHSYHFAQDIAWMLDAVLWEETIKYQPFRSPLSQPQEVEASRGFKLFSDGPQQLYMPQSKREFETITTRDQTNALMLALSLQLDASRLRLEGQKQMRPFMEAFPEMNERISFHTDLSANSSEASLTCAPRLSSGAKNGILLHERVCRRLREESYQLFNIEESPPANIGQSYFAQPPKRLIIFHRHITRGFSNLEELEMVFRRVFGPYGVEVEVVTGKMMPTVEDQVRLFSRAGVLFSPHGSQLMGQMWMPRHR